MPSDTGENSLSVQGSSNYLAKRKSHLSKEDSLNPRQKFFSESGIEIVNTSGETTPNFNRMPKFYTNH